MKFKMFNILTNYVVRRIKWITKNNELVNKDNLSHVYLQKHTYSKYSNGNTHIQTGVHKWFS